MNIIRELRKKKGIQQKELALIMGVSNPTVSNWEQNKNDPSGEHLKKLAEFFECDEMVILGKAPYVSSNPSYFIPANPEKTGVSETEQIIHRVLESLSDKQPKTEEAAVLVRGVDRLPKEQREQLLRVAQAMFPEYPDYFTKEKPKNDA